MRNNFLKRESVRIDITKLLKINQMFLSLLKLLYYLGFFNLPIFFFLTSLLEYNCFTMLCQFLLYNKVNQLYVCIYPHIPSLLHLPPTLPIPPLQLITKHQADLPVLCSCFPLAIYFTFGSVYMSMLLSHFVPAYPAPFKFKLSTLVYSPMEKQK